MSTQQDKKEIDVEANLSAASPPPPKPVHTPMPVHWVALGMFINFVTATGIVFLNRKLFLSEFTFVILLTIIHYFITWAGCWIAILLGKVERKQNEASIWSQLWLFALGFALGVPFCNASIKFNTLGTYQISKALMTPVSILIEIFYYKRTFSTNVLLTVVPIITGVIYTGYADVEISSIGLLVGLGCVLISVLTQIWSQNKQKELDMNSMQLMYYTTPLSVGVLVVSSPLIDDFFGPNGIINFEVSWFVTSLVVITGICAGVINMTIYFILKETSPVTYQIFGHVKTCTILFGSFIFFDQQLTANYLIGMAITMFGAFGYTYVKLNNL
eukprot:TRINITY_DN8015_c0_g1_i1.p1 TRINITY_DN8015_c0_g1~~TRINITY_DN8015_c0_g1_i1.p1  ORF type:complete len:329 (-),score=48.74 TRINITY_DN8015_c0_g1_i1:44-1030(-)